EGLVTCGSSVMTPNVKQRAAAAACRTIKIVCTVIPPDRYDIPRTISAADAGSHLRREPFQRLDHTRGRGDGEVPHTVTDAGLPAIRSRCATPTSGSVSGRDYSSAATRSLVQSSCTIGSCATSLDDGPSRATPSAPHSSRDHPAPGPRMIRGPER